MRIVCVTHAYPRFDGDIAGAFIERFVLALVRRGHTVAVVAPADAGRGGREVRHGVTVVRVRYAPARWETLAYRGTMAGAVGSLTGLLAFVALVARLSRAAAVLARSMSADLVHAHWWVPAGLAAWWLRRLGGPPYAVTMHGTDVALLEHSRLGRFLARRVLGGAATITTVSSYLADRAAELAGADRRRIAVCPMPLETSRFGRTSQGGGGAVTLGRLTTQKRIAILIEAVNRLAAEGHPVPLTIVGDGPERPALERLVTELGLRSIVRFTGQVEPERVSDALDDADVFAFPARQEGFGLAVAEALLQGIPVVAAKDGGGVADILPTGGAGYLIEPEPAAFARAIRELRDDPGARARAAEAGAVLRERLSPDTVARVLEGVLSRATA